MGNRSTNAHEKKPNADILHVWYESNAALGEGEAVCYNQDYGTATAFDGRRLNRVETPSTTNAQYFAGVADKAYSAVSTGQFIRIYAPGSVCNIRCGKDTDTVINVGLLTFDVTTGFKGEFRYAGLSGRGSARILQTTTGDASDPGLCMAQLLDGPESGGVEVVPLVATGAMAAQMVGGTTLVTGGSIASGHNTVTLADGTIPGLRKKYGIITTQLTSYDVVITVTSGASGELSDTSLDTVTFGQASTCLNTTCTLEWDGAWFVSGKTEDVPVLGGS